MEPDKNTTATDTNEQVESVDSPAPADALSRTPDDLEQEQVAEAAASPTHIEKPTEKKTSPLKRFMRRMNVYFLIFVLLLVIAGAATAVMYFNSQKPVDEAEIATQELTREALEQLSNTNASIGGSSQTLTIRGNATIEGQTLMRNNLNVAGNFQSGGTIQGSGLTIAGSSSLDDAEINTLQVSSNAAIQGNTTLRNLSVSGTTSLSGAVTAAQLTVSRLVLSGNAILEVPNHLRFTGPTPGRSTGNALGSGGSVSISGSDTSGTVNIRTGNNPSSGCFVRVTFRQAFASSPRVIVTPIGSAAGKTQFYVERENGNFRICTANSAPGNSSFGFDYFVAG